MHLDKKKLDLISSSIDTLYQDKSFVDLSLPERLMKISDVLQSTDETHKEVVETWNTEDRKDSPHHHTNRLD